MARSNGKQSNDQQADPLAPMHLRHYSLEMLAELSRMSSRVRDRELSSVLLCAARMIDELGATRRPN